MVARVGGSLDELGYDERVGRDVGVAKAEIDDVFARTTSVEFALVHSPEDVGRQLVNTPEVHRERVPAQVVS